MSQEVPGLRVFKFGGASVKDAAAVFNLCRIVRQESTRGPLLIVVSAMGKTTNALERIYELGYRGEDYLVEKTALDSYHLLIGREVLAAVPAIRLQPFGPIDGILKYHFAAFAGHFHGKHKVEYDEGYDQIVSIGERLSAKIIQLALLTEFEGSEIVSLVAGTMLRTDDTWRESRVDWPETERLTRQAVAKALAAGAKIIVSEGFIGRTADGRTTTLGREGSDYSAAIFAYCLNAESVTIWKDVPGLLSADPKLFADAVLYPEVSYQETIEMAYYGASVIHPKTIRPLAERGIPLYVRSFLDPAAPGTLIHDCRHPPLAPAIIRKTGQGLISFASKDFAFISEENLEVIFGALAAARLKINLMQNSALSFSVVVDFDAARMRMLLARLAGQFRVQYNTDLSLFTIKNYDAASVEKLTAGRVLLLEQRTRSTFQFLVRE